MAEKERQYKYRQEIQQMMYVSGEAAEPTVETTGMIEEIVRQQVVEILRLCTELAARRGSRAISINDLIFLIRHDAPKVSRLRQFLSWKDVRKNVKDSDDKGVDGADIGAEDAAAAGAGAAGVPGGPGPVESVDASRKNKKAKVALPWEPSSFYTQEVPERDDEDDEEEEEMNHITLQRLHKADERTKAMTKEEYVTWSEYRQASFTYRKGKRFREWAGFGTVTDSKPSDDIVDILGFLTFEMVQTLTEEALKVKEQEDLFRERTGGGDKAGNGGNGTGNGEKKRKISTLFDPPSEGRSPVEAKHIQEAFRRLQARTTKSRAMLNGSKLQAKYGLKLF
ncbi:putative spt3-like protein [Zalerion maritima]|uniref:Spt3-like protein n=1 Tax=Zalerion maritima TaxID=339359 RepID=A0AAD5RL04_9PEZI|nr:putative spt3-like protein [Zalerion maritima]